MVKHSEQCVKCPQGEAEHTHLDTHVHPFALRATQDNDILLMLSYERYCIWKTFQLDRLHS